MIWLQKPRRLVRNSYILILVFFRTKVLYDICSQKYFFSIFEFLKIRVFYNVTITLMYKLGIYEFAPCFTILFRTGTSETYRYRLLMIIYPRILYVSRFGKYIYATILYSTLDTFPIKAETK